MTSRRQFITLLGRWQIAEGYNSVAATGSSRAALAAKAATSTIPSFGGRFGQLLHCRGMLLAVTVALFLLPFCRPPVFFPSCVSPLLNKIRKGRLDLAWATCIHKQQAHNAPLRRAVPLIYLVPGINPSSTPRWRPAHPRRAAPGLAKLGKVVGAGDGRSES